MARVTPGPANATFPVGSLSIYRRKAKVKLHFILGQVFREEVTAQGGIAETILKDGPWTRVVALLLSISLTTQCHSLLRDGPA
jgi:hypothetical protein